MVSRSAWCARVIVEQLIAQGVRDIVLCPGSRSAPFAIALAQADAAGRVRLHVRVDERSAGFLALGLSKAYGTPSAIVTTSGTAVGNLMPAVMEAHHAGVGLVVVSTDRPASSVGFGANQTTDQVGIFGRFVCFAARATSLDDPSVWSAQAARAVVASGSGPVHLNVELGLPLVGDVPDEPVIEPVSVTRGSGRGVVELESGPRTVVIAGDAGAAVGVAASALANEGMLPLIAEPSSNARVGDALTCGRLLLDTDLADEIERVIVFGHPTLSRPVMRLLARDDVEVVAVATDEWPDPGHRVHRVVPAATIAPDDGAWLRRWREADEDRARRVRAIVEAEGLSGWLLASRVWDACAESGHALMLGASQLIRDTDLAPVRRTGPVVAANRGLAGIDGTLATAMGMALGLQRPTTLLCGDLTFLHDSNALAIGPGERRPDLRIVVGDDRGGAIFSTLEYGADAFADVFERVFATDPGVDLDALSAAYGIPVTRARALDELDAALARELSGIEVVLVELDRSRRREVDAAIRAL